VPSAARQYASPAPLIFPSSAARPASPTVSPKRDFEAAAFGLQLDNAEGLRNLKLAVDSELGIPTRLTAVGIAEKDVELLASESMKQTRLLPNNPGEVTVTPLADARRLYMQAL
jgi:alcohol dehydrogenase class IV